MKPERTPLPEEAARYREDGWWIDRTLIDFFDEAVARDPEKIAIIDQRGNRISYGDMSNRVDCIAANLVARGIGAGDVITVQLPNWAETMSIHLAATRIGAITNPLLTNYRRKELSYILGFAKTAAVFIPNVYKGFDYPEMYREIRKELPDLHHVFVVDDVEVEGFEPFAVLENICPKIKDHQSCGDDVTAIIFTSGTTSKPKGVMHTHNTLMYMSRYVPEILNITGDDVIWMPSPVGHGTGFGFGMRTAITLGATLVLQDIYEAEEALRIIEAERVSFTFSATPFVTMLLESPSLKSRDLSSFRVFACAGAPIPEHIALLAREKIGCKLIGAYGMTEVYLATASSFDDPMNKQAGTDGRALPGFEVAIFSEDRTTQLPAGEVGEVGFRGPSVSMGYFNAPERTSESFTPDGWLFSDDLGCMDKDGYIRIVGRKKDIINRGGLKISAREVEEMILKHPAVANVAIVPVPDERLGEKACAYVIRRDNQEYTFGDMIAQLESAGTAKYKQPEYLIPVDEFPMTSSGKIQKFKLTERFTTERG